MLILGPLPEHTILEEQVFEIPTRHIIFRPSELERDKKKNDI